MPRERQYMRVDRYLFARHAFVFAATVAAIQAGRPPLPADASAPDTEFSAERAMAHLEVIAARPHPAGSKRNAVVRDYLVQTLEALGMEVHIQREEDFDRSPENICARLKGSGDGAAVLLMAHYDSVPAAPGAGDDGSGVAAIIEAVRALKARGTFRNDLMVVFTDAEELGLYGAWLFVRAHPWMEEIGVVLNFDARGNQGPVFMVQTLGDNGWLIRALAEVGERPTTNSGMAVFLELMPNDSDLTCFKWLGIPGMNFVCAGGVSHYHSPADTVDALDPGMVQHHGVNALNLAEFFLERDLKSPPEDRVIYASVLSRWLVYYPSGWAPYLTGLAALAWLASLIFSKPDAARIRGLLAGAVLFIFLTGLLSAGGNVAWGFLFDRELAGRKLSDWHPPLFLASWAAVFGGFHFALRYLRRKPTRSHVEQGPLVAILGLLLLSTAAWPGLTYLLVWPLFGSLLTLAWLRYRDATPNSRVLTESGAALLQLPATVLFAPWIWASMDAFFYAAGFPIAVLALYCALLGPWLFHDCQSTATT